MSAKTLHHSVCWSTAMDINSGTFLVILTTFLLLLTDQHSTSAVQVSIVDTTKSESLNWLTYTRGESSTRRGWREASYTRTQGDVVRVYTVCNVAVSSVDNWLRTPYIAPSPANRLYIELHFTMRKCTKYPNPGRLQQCKESLKLLYREVDSGVESSAAADVDNNWSEEFYQHIDVIAADRVFTDNTDAVVNTETRSVAPAPRHGVYFAFRDQGACATLLSVHVYYITCPPVVAAFSVFGETPAGPEVTSIVQRDGACVDNAVVTTGSSRPSYLCKADGSWYFLSGTCQCLPGYEPRNATQCTACSVQMYKSSTGSDVCRPCPRHSETVNSASTSCHCQHGFYRNSVDTESSPCTAPPSPVLDLVVIYHDHTTVNLSWSRPVDLGGRHDLYYRLECIECDDNAVYLPSQAFFNTTRASLLGLRPGTTYRIIVHAENGVSELAGHRAPADVTVVTETAVPDKIRNVRVISVGTDHVTLSWESQNHLAIEQYQVRHWPTSHKDITADNSTNSTNITLVRLVHGTAYSFKVRGKSSKGWGEYSDVITATTGLISHYPSDNPVGIIIGSAVAVIICMIIVVIMIAIFVRRSSRLAHDKQVVDYDDVTLRSTFQCPQGHIDGTLVIDSRMTIPLFAKQNSNYTRTYVDPHTYEDPTRAVREFAKEIDSSCIIIESVIGGGEFGDVCKGHMKLNGQRDLEVAIKTLKSGTSEKSRLDFLTEASIMGQFTDPNVIYLQGVVTRSHPTMIVTEFMQNGSLDTFLRNNDGQFSVIQLIGMVRGIASGMCYLSGMGYVHRDLAARNILVDRNLVCKVSDFGLSREVEVDSSGGTYTTKGGKIPVRWTAPEAITYRKFTSASDVWSYGVVMWEVMTFGERPYWNWTNQDVIKAVETGYRLPPPMDCPETVYQLMLDCWQPERSQRPKFSAIVKILDKLTQFPELLKDIAKPRMTDEVSTMQEVNDDMQRFSLAQEHLYSSVAEWLIGIKMDRYIDNFERCGFTSMDSVSQITRKDLAILGVSLVGHQKKILNSVQALRLHVQPATQSTDPLLA